MSDPTSKPQAWQRRVHIGLQEARVFHLGVSDTRSDGFFADVPVRLGMQIAFGRVRRKTEPTGPGGPLN